MKDASGASIRDATLTLRDQKAGVQTETHSDANGLYQFPNLNPSIYSLAVSAGGFSGREAKDITVLVGQIVWLDLDLSVASVSQTVEVSNSGEVLQTEKFSTGTNITGKLVGRARDVHRHCAESPAGVCRKLELYYAALYCARQQHRAELYRDIRASYAWSHAIDNMSSLLGTTFDSSTPASSNLPLDAQRGNSAYDQRHRFVNVFVYQLPFGRGGSVLPSASGWLNQIIGGWSLSGITNLASGQPFTIITNSNVDYSGFNQLNDRPNLFVNSLTFNRSNPDAFFSPLAFAPNGSGQVGTSPRNAYYGPGLINFDATLAKRFPVSERIGLELRGEFFNALKHTNFALTNATRNLRSGQFGQLSSTSTFNGGATGSRGSSRSPDGSLSEKKHAPLL